MICPHCKGEGVSFAFVDYTDGTGSSGIHPCLTCKGEKEVPDEMAAWIEEGEWIRYLRVHAGEYRNLRDEAARLGLDVVTLSRMERGEIQPYTLKESGS